jgi:mannose-6-phosphate isomerase-like protein (cupin superfamily)
MIASHRRDARVRENRETGGAGLESKRLEDRISFSEEKMQKNAFFDSPHLFYDAYCLLPGQVQKVHSHDGSDKVYFVMRGTGRFTIGDEEEDLTEGNAVIARAGTPHGVRNDSEDQLILLVTMAPRPA